PRLGSVECKITRRVTSRRNPRGALPAAGIAAQNGDRPLLLLVHQVGEFVAYRMDAERRIRRPGKGFAGYSAFPVQLHGHEPLPAVLRISADVKRHHVPGNAPALAEVPAAPRRY